MKDRDSQSKLQELYKLYIKNTRYKQPIEIRKDLLCEIKGSTYKILASFSGCRSRRVFLNTRSLKHIYDRHIYDKRTPQDFKKILDNFINIVKYPHQVRMDLDSKRGDFLFVREINKKTYFISIEVVENGTIEIVSSSVSSKKYLKKFTLLWSWRTANSPS